MIKAGFIGGKIVSVSEDAFSLYEKSRFGEKSTKGIEYSGVEAIFLTENKKLELADGKRTIDAESLMKRLKKGDKKIETKYHVFADLRKKGYVVKSALKFGAEFRVYERGAFPGEEHARWILFTSKESETMNWHDFSAKNRVAHSTKKNLLLGVVDDEGDVSYYEVAWMKI
jgi:tRNA-intron endonuclease, archaea type